MSYEECCNYFRDKCLEWDSKPPYNDMKKYIKSKGKSGLASEFRSDSLFQDIICPYLKNYAKGKEKETASEIIKTANSLLGGSLFTVEINLIIAAVLIACGFSDEASTLLKIAVGGLVLAGLVGILGSALKK